MPQDTLCVLYTLGRLDELAKPKINPEPGKRGQRFSSHRWTSRLAIERAGDLHELLLETEAEWRLYEELRARGVGFRLRPLPAREPSQSAPRGRVWFVTDSGQRVRYAGASGYRLEHRGTVRFEARVDEVLRRVDTRSNAARLGQSAAGSEAVPD